MRGARPAAWLCMNGRLQWLVRLKGETTDPRIVPASQPYRALMTVRDLSGSRFGEPDTGQTARQQADEDRQDQAEPYVAPIARLTHGLVGQHQQSRAEQGSPNRA